MNAIKSIIETEEQARARYKTSHLEDLEEERAKLRKEEKRGRYKQDKLLKAMALINEELEELKDNYNDFIDRELRPTVNKLKSINHNIKWKRQVRRKNHR